ncbi:MAG: hypothetical protein P8Y94_02585 [Acidobacteriota bacterium]
MKRNLLKPEIPVSRRLPSLAVLGLLLLFSGVLLQAAGLPQDNQPQAKFSVKTYSTLMEVRVFDQFGNFVPSLQRNDFQVTVKSRPRELLSFKEEEKTPTSLAILIDIGSSMKEADIQTAKQAILDLIHLMPHDDELLLGVYDRDVDFLSSLGTWEEGRRTICVKQVRVSSQWVGRTPWGMPSICGETRPARRNS